MKTQVQFIGGRQAQLTIDANVALLDMIGTPVILLTHSQGGWFGWNIADERPDLVRRNRDIGAGRAAYPRCRHDQRRLIGRVEASHGASAIRRSLTTRRQRSI